MLPIALLLLGGLFLALALPDGSDDEVQEEEDPPIEGDDTDNALMGTEEDDDILGYAGNDRLDGEGRNDLLEGGDGYDSLYGGTGDDTLDAGTRDNLLYGGEGNDLLVSLEGYGVMEGGSGDDTLVSDGPKSLYGGEGNDIFQLELVTMEDQPYPTFYDFTPGEDKLVIRYTPTPGVEPDIVISPDDSTFGQNSYLEFNGLIIGYILGEFGLGYEDIILMPVPEGSV